MPPGVGCATVLEPLNAALMAAKIFAVTDHDIAELVKSYQESQRVRILEADLEVSG
jgi:5-(carboxyamino)imidazole ribonucleotide mutase/phosphoribosylaminoimidazole-succinocarboxamide synthase